MLSVAVDILRTAYGIPTEKIIPIHHGAPDCPFSDENTKTVLGLEGRTVMSSVNLISEGKGIEYALAALPEVAAAYPEFLYLIVGQTHPVILEREGEAYREKLQGLVKDLKLENNVRFVNEYVSLEELVQYVRASDFYITPYENMEQISSGSLAYAIAAGKLCISTPYRYAQEMLAGGRGYLVTAQSPAAITQALLDGLHNPEKAHRMRVKCYSQGRRMVWSRVGFSHLRVLEHIIKNKGKAELPKPNLSYLHFLTDEVGLLEHSHQICRTHVESRQHQ
jgi:glycosyltransferase involved in cell wall biosynthesis